MIPFSPSSGLVQFTPRKNLPFLKALQWFFLIHCMGFLLIDMVYKNLTAPFVGCALTCSGHAIRRFQGAAEMRGPGAVNIVFFNGNNYSDPLSVDIVNIQYVVHLRTRFRTRGGGGGGQKK
jgi:hypothetical protein